MSWLTTELLYLLRVFIALVLGFFIGLERKKRGKEAGMRTHAIVCAGAALMTLVGKFGFSGDGSRVAAQVVTGIGFLGAGIIMYRRDSMKGVTTAAGIWATAGIGMAAGVGMYVVAVGVAVLIVGLQYFLHLRIPLFKNKVFYIYSVKFVCEEDENKKIKELFGVKNYSRISYYNTENGLSATAEISTSRIVSDEDIKKVMLENAFITAVERIYQLD